MSDISPDKRAARENARGRGGLFGVQERSAPDVSLTTPALSPRERRKALAGTGEHADAIYRLRGRAVTLTTRTWDGREIVGEGRANFSRNILDGDRDVVLADGSTIRVAERLIERDLPDIPDPADYTTTVKEVRDLAPGDVTVSVRGKDVSFRQVLTCSQFESMDGVKMQVVFADAPDDPWTFSNQSQTVDIAL